MDAELDPASSLGDTRELDGRVRYEPEPPILVVTIDRPEVRNAVDRPTAAALAAAFRRFEADPELSVAVLTGAGGTFCAGADLKGIAEGRGNRVVLDGD
ncbi:MAG: enoyl-CoA hydratase-related protein, partial [Acidimicrobiales bacterium]